MLSVILSSSALLFSIFLGFLVIFRNKKDPVNLFFSLVIFCSTFWIFTNMMVDVSETNEIAMFWNKLTLIGPIFIAPLFLIFCSYFPKREPKINRWIQYLLFIPALAFVPFIPTSFNIAAVEITEQGVSVTPGILYLFFQIFFAVYFLTALYFLVSKFRKVKGVTRTQIKYMFLGAAFTTVIGFITNAVLLFIGIWQYAGLGPLSIIFLLSFTSYAIVKHRLMDIRMVVARSVAYSVLIVMLAAIYAGGVFGFERILFPSKQALNFSQVALRTVLAVIMAFTFQPLRKWITKLTDKMFFKNQYDQGELLDAVSHKIGETIILVELIYKTLDLLIAQMKVSRGIFVILSDEGKIYNMQSVGYKKLPKVATADALKMAKDGIIVYDELEEGSHYKNLLRRYDAAVSIPLRTENTTEGILLLGEKSSGDMFSAMDLRVFEIIAPELAIAITNAKAYERIERFNITLRQEVKKATIELEEKNEQLRELDKAKDEFISMASHQLRTPLTAIKGYLSMLLEGDAGEIKVSQYDFVNEAFAGANRMVGLINDLLNVSRMETGRFFLEPVEVNLERLVQEEIKQLENHARDKKLYLKFEKKSKIPKIWADETKIRQVVMNFIDNAIYYTTKGGVTVTLSADAKDVKLEVTDTGIGIPKTEQGNLFTKFYRADNARHVRPDGTGLGIYLAKRVVSDHGGEIIFRSQEGKGSTFGFKFPIKSNLKIKRVSAPAPAFGTNGTPPVGELAAGIGASAETLKTTEAKITGEKIAEDSKVEGLKLSK